ncbi:MAG: carboxypeptidase regulatory-like domain-containing protein [Ignavibacteria bacterium]|nr:carboxypeptidase regulatory-like domain-containing protein [Ignavibacteria bacterium]
MKKLVILFLLITGFVYSQNTNIIVPTGGQTIYDFQSYGAPMHIIQDKNNPDFLHAVYMTLPYNDTSSSSRITKYYLSTDKGLTWRFVSNVPVSGESDFPSISLLSTGIPIISVNITSGTNRRVVSYVDAFPGLGSFIDLGSSGCNGAFPSIVGSNSISQTHKFHILTYTGFSSGLSITNQSYSSCLPLPDIFGFSEKCCIAQSGNGKVGIAYISKFNTGDVYFMESEDNGISFSYPVKIFDAEDLLNGTFLGANKGISIVYRNNVPNVVFEAAMHDSEGNTINSKSGGIVFWSESLQGQDPYKYKYIARNDSCGHASYIPFYKSFGKDYLSSICRPSIGAFSDSNYLAVVFTASSQRYKIKNADTVSYHDVYFTYSSDKGATWKKPYKLNEPEDKYDWTYPSVSPYNFSNQLPYTVNITATRDTLPGSFVNNPSIGKSLAEQYYIGAKITNSTEPGLYTITSGNVKYNDNFQSVTSGIVKAIQWDEASGQVYVRATSPIDGNGNYSLNLNFPNEAYYIVAYPNSEPETDFIPTYYPQTIDWQNAETINSSLNNNNINIAVFRKITIAGDAMISGTVHKVQNNFSNSLSQAFVIIKYGTSFAGFTESSSDGKFTFKDIPKGNYKVVATKLGYSTAMQNVTIENGSFESLSFNLKQILNDNSHFLPGGFYLYQNYPNPFNPVTNIKFDVPKASFVTVRIYNSLGREIALLVNETKQAGSYAIDFNASSLSSGVYYYRLQTEGFIETRKMVLLK